MFTEEELLKLSIDDIIDYIIEKTGYNELITSLEKITPQEKKSE